VVDVTVSVAGSSAVSPSPPSDPTAAEHAAAVSAIPAMRTVSFEFLDTMGPVQCV
jgi:hypothetical protein